MSRFESLRGLSTLQELLGKPSTQYGAVAPSGSSTHSLASDALKAEIRKHYKDSKRSSVENINTPAKRVKESPQDTGSPKLTLHRFFSQSTPKRGSSFLDAIAIDLDEGNEKVLPSPTLRRSSSAFEPIDLDPPETQQAEEVPDEPALPSYYLENFFTIVRATIAKDAHLLSTEEAAIIQKLEALPTDAAKLFVRLYSRKKLLFSSNRLKYNEISNLSQQLATLARTEFGRLVSVAGDNLPSIFALLTVEELKEVCRLSAVLKSTPLSDRNREGYLKALVGAPKIRTLDGSVGLAPPVRKYIVDQLGVIFEISTPVKQLFQRLHRLFFLSNDPDQSYLIVLAGKGSIRFPQYEVTACRSIYPTREALLEYEDALRQGEELYGALEKGNDAQCEGVIQAVAEKLAHASARERSLEATPTRLFTARFSAGSAYASILTVGISYLESQRKYESAILFLRSLLDCPFNSGKRGDWYERLCLDMEHLGQKDNALLVCEEALGEVLRPSNRVGLEKRYLRLHKPPRRWSAPKIEVTATELAQGFERWVFGKRRQVATGQKSRFMGYNGNFCGVEELALQHYRLLENWEGEHCEGSLLVNLWTLLFYDILFMPVPEVFQHKFQVGPLDLPTAAFYPSRKDAIDSRLELIKTGDFQLLTRHWDLHFGEQCVGLSWDRPLPTLVTVAECLGGPVLASICDIFCRKYGSSRYVVPVFLILRSGLPDLLLWIPTAKKAKFVEVKGPNDRLSDKQRVWIDLLVRSGADVEVCHVTEDASRVQEESLLYPTQQEGSVPEVEAQ